MSRTNRLAFAPVLQSSHLAIPSGYNLGYRATPTQYTTANQVAASTYNTYSLSIPGWTGSGNGDLGTNTGISSMLTSGTGFYIYDNTNTLTFPQNVNSI